MGAEADLRAESAGHSQSSEAEPDLAAGAAVDVRPSTEDRRNSPSEVTPIADWKTCAPLLRDCNYGGSFCELLVVEAIQEYVNFHGLQETQKALVQVQSRVALENAFGSMVPDPDDSHCQGAKSSDVQAELAVMNVLHDFDEGLREPFLQRWKVLVPSTSPTGGSLELRLRVYFGTYKTRKALLANDPETPLLEPDFSDLKAFLSSRPAAVGMESTHSLSSLYALPFVPQPHQNSALRFIFEEPWAQQLRSDVKAFLTAYTSTRHAPFFRHLAGWMIMSRCPTVSPPFTSWQELLRLADISLNASTHAAKLQTFGSPPAPQSLEPGHESYERSEELLNWLGAGGKLLPEMRKQVADLRRRLGAVARRPADEAPSVQETPSMRPSIQSLVRAQSVDWEPQGGNSTPVPVLQDRLWPREALRGSSASSLNASNSNAGAVRRLHSARSIESRARAATALLPVPPALDFGRIAAVLNGEDAGGTPPILSVLRAVLRRLALPDEAIRPRRAFLAAFACFGAVRALAGRLPEIMTGDSQLLEMSLAVMGVCACEVVGRREIEAAEAQGTGCISALISIVSGQRSLQHMHCLAVLQRLSLRGRLQSKMIQLGALDVVLKLLKSVKLEADAQWCRLGPGEGPETPDFSIEFTSALLMNLTLRSAGRRRCAELGAYTILVGLIEHPNAQVRTHINGTLYTLLGVKAIRSEAQKRGAEVIFRSALERVSPENELLQRQLEFLLHQLSRSAGDADSDGEDSEDGDPPQTVAAPEDGGAGDADDGDNFLDEEELAAHFHLASTSAVGPGDGYSQAEIDANSKTAAAEAAAAEEALRYFRATAGPVADSQQRRFHAFVARSCRNLMSPKRRGHSSDRLASPLSPPMMSPSSSPEPSHGCLKSNPGPPVTVTSVTSAETPPSQRPPHDEEVPMDEFWEASPIVKGSGKGDAGGKSGQAQERGPSKPRSQSLGSGRPESRQQPAPAPKGDADNKGRSTSGPAAGAAKGRGRGARPGQPPGGAAVTKSASLPPLPENKASGGRNPTSGVASRARSEAPKRNQQASKAAAAIEVAASVGQERGFRRRNVAERSAKDSHAQLPQLPKRR